MKVGLIRHFRVKQAYPQRLLVTPAEVAQWLTAYDTAEIEDGTVDLGAVHWKRCFASDLPRAVRTAQQIYHGEIITTAALREVPAYTFPGQRLKLPFLLWAVLSRLGWFFNTKSQAEANVAIKQRVAALLDQILESEEDVLIVSHAAMMRNLQLELRRRGFRGPAFGVAANGRLYVLER